MKPPKPPTQAQLNRIVDHWNRDFEVGTEVTYERVKGRTAPDNFVDTETTSVGFVMGGHSAMVKVKGISGAVSLEHIKIRKEQP